jgi:hypothetical protein
VNYRLLPYISEGDIVTYGGGSTLYKVTRVKQVKCLAIESGTGRRVEMRIEHCKKIDDPSRFVAKPEDEVPPPTLEFGMAVRFKNPSAKTQGVFVVTHHTSSGWRVSRLGGGEGTRYFHSIEAERLVPVDAINLVDWSKE